MIHEFIDYKKKIKNNGITNGKTLQDSVETCSVEQSGSEWPSPTFVPPWLNNLGLKLKNNQMYGAFIDKLRPDIKNQNQYEQIESEGKKSTVEENVSKKSCYFESLPKECQEGFIHISDSRDKLNSVNQNPEGSNNINRIPTFCQIRSKLGDAESSSTESTMSPYIKKKKNSKISEAEFKEKSLGSYKQFRNYQEKKQKLPKKFNRLKHRSTSNNSPFLREEDIDFLLEEKAKKVLENYSKKSVQSTALDIKRFEAKLLLLHTKIASGKLTPDDMRFLQEIKTRAGSKENFDKLMRHVREVNLKEIFETQNSVLKSAQAKADMPNANSHSRKGGKILLSTDDENDIKRFSDKLKKNLNKEEKRKCLEEVRNYFENKRRTQLTKCWMLNQESGIEGEESLKHERENMKNMFSDRSTADWKSKFRINDAEVVGKAVDETLQKFAEMYHFHVSPSLMSSMKNNVLKGIQSKSIEGQPPLTWHNDVPCNVEGDNLSKKLKNSIKEDYAEKNSLSLDTKTKRLKDRTLSNSQIILKDAFENEQMKRLTSEMEYYINNANEYVTKLKVQSIILEEEKEVATGKNIQFVYSFTKKSLQQKTSKSVETRHSVDVEVQADKNLTITINEKTQTHNLVAENERAVQTEDIPQKSVDAQTEGAFAIELRMLKECDVSPRLYRMVRSKQAGRFYLYPENEDHTKRSLEVREEKNISDIYDARKFKDKKLNDSSDESEPDTKKGEADVSNVHVVDGVKLDKADLSNISEIKQECVWLWDGKKINSGSDLKAYVDTLLKEKLRGMSLEDAGKDRLNYFLDNLAKEVGTSSQDNLEFTISHPGFRLGNEQTGSIPENKIQSFGEGSAETQSLGELHLTSEEKFVKDASTQNSEQAILSLNVKTWKSPIKPQTSSKTYLRKKRKPRMKRDQHCRRSIVDLKKAMHLVSECLSNKRMKFEIDSSTKESICDSGTTCESMLSSFCKDTSDDHLTLIFGLKDGRSCKSRRSRRTVNEEVQAHNGKNERKNLIDGRRMENHTHWELIERVLHTVNCKKRKSLWNDLRELIKSKLGKDIGNENPKEVCIQIEQDMHGALGVKARDFVLAKGYYAKNEGDVEVEIDLTLDDLERIVRRRERSRRKRSLYYKRYGRSLRSSSPRVNGTNFASIQEFRDVLRRFSRARPTPLAKDLRVIRMNKQN